MKVICYNNKIYNINLSQYYNKEGENKSSLHLKCRDLIKEVFKMRVVLEEVYIPIEKLYLDFFIPDFKLVIEVHGAQHFNFNKFHYKDKLDFYNSQGRDNKKREFCKNNKFYLVELSYNEKVSEWRNKLLNYKTN